MECGQGGTPFPDPGRSGATPFQGPGGGRGQGVGWYPFLGPGGGRGYPPVQVKSQDGGGGRGQAGGVLPVQVRSRGGYPYRNSIACTCYAAGGMPLAFTQGDFLVQI